MLQSLQKRPQCPIQNSAHPACRRPVVSLTGTPIAIMSARFIMAAEHDVEVEGGDLACCSSLPQAPINQRRTAQECFRDLKERFLLSLRGALSLSAMCATSAPELRYWLKTGWGSTSNVKPNKCLRGRSKTTSLPRWPQNPAILVFQFLIPSPFWTITHRGPMSPLCLSEIDTSLLLPFPISKAKVEKSTFSSRCPRACYLLSLKPPPNSDSSFAPMPVGENYPGESYLKSVLVDRINSLIEQGP